jgi:erythronate-4-phosphate dehydrogenase
MKILVDENIVFAKEAFAELGEVELIHGRKINNDLLKDVDALIVRSITKVGPQLLQDT